VIVLCGLRKLESPVFVPTSTLLAFNISRDTFSLKKDIS
jgi:hypothetical protein